MSQNQKFRNWKNTKFAGMAVTLAILVPGPPRLFGLVHNDDAMATPFSQIKKLGEDVILVEINS